MALILHGAHGLEITALNEGARAIGLRVGTSLADARAALPTLLTLPADPDADRRDLIRLAHWCGRYGPARHVDGEDGLWIDTTGVAHLFAPKPTIEKACASVAESLLRPELEEAEHALLADLVGRLAQFGLSARAGCADTLGAAHALARFASSSQCPFVIAPPGGTLQALAPLPMAALRISPQTMRLLERLGLRRIGQLYDMPRPALERRFRDLHRKKSESHTMVAALLLRLDQALGTHGEPRTPLVETPDFVARLPFPDPLLTAAGIEAALAHLCLDLARTLQDAGMGGRRFRLALYRSDGSSGEAVAGTSAPCRDAEHIRRLLLEKIAQLDAGFGVDVMTLAAAEVTRLEAHQEGLETQLRLEQARAATQLVDRLSGRLGTHRVMRLQAHASHIPEAAQACIPALTVRNAPLADTRQGGATRFSAHRRPAFLLSPPEPIEVLAAVPEGAPALIVWRRLRRRIVRAEGPERIAPEWWKAYHPRQSRAGGPSLDLIRDYYLIEDAGGARYWVFRAGLYGSSTQEEYAPKAGDLPAPAPRWFMHGLMA